MKNRINIRKWFTLVELIVVITILAILSTIGFISLQNFNMSARDGVRLADINNIQKWLSVYTIASWNYPKPDDFITIYSSGSVIGYQWYFWETGTRVLKMDKIPLDPLDKSRYPYLVNYGQTDFQLIWYLENSSPIAFDSGIVPQAYAANIDYSTRTLKSYGKELWFLFVNTGSNANIPLHELRNELSFTGVDIKTYTWVLSNGENIWDLKAVFNNKIDDNIVWTGSILIRLENIYWWLSKLVMDWCPTWWKDLWNSSWLGTASVVYSWGISTWRSTKICETNKILSISKWYKLTMQ